MVSLPFIAIVVTASIVASLYKTRGGDGGRAGRSEDDSPEEREPVER